MMLHFNSALVEQLLGHAKSASDHCPLYADARTKKVGLWRVDDDGVYLMSNGLPRLLQPDNAEKAIVAYAQEVNPTTMEFDDWWGMKRASFGGDDGCEFFAAEEIAVALATYRAGEDLMLDVTSVRMALISYKPLRQGRPKG